jgi:hypothetical protein
MQSEFPLTWLGWKELVLAIFASLVTGGGIYRYINIWLNRKKPEAEATEITIRARVTEGDALSRWMDRLEVAQRNIDRLRSERDSWQDEYDRVFVERDELLKINTRLTGEVRGYAIQIEQMNATLKKHNLNYDDTQGVPIDIKILKNDEL